MSLPPGPASSCKRALRKRVRSQTLKDIGRLCCARQPPPHHLHPPTKPGLVWLLAPSPWFWWMPDELKCARRVQSTHSSIAPASVPSPCLPWHFLNLMEKKNEPITNQVKCQTAYLSVLMSNNDQVAANQPMSAVPVSCWEGGRMSAVCCLLTREAHKLKAVKGSQIQTILPQTQNNWSLNRPDRENTNDQLRAATDERKARRLSKGCEWARDDPEVFTNVRDHSPDRPVGTRQTNPAASAWWRVSSHQDVSLLGCRHL